MRWVRFLVTGAYPGESRDFTLRVSRGEHVVAMPGDHADRMLALLRVVSAQRNWKEADELLAEIDGASGGAGACTCTTVRGRPTEELCAFCEGAAKEGT